MLRPSIRAMASVARDILWHTIIGIAGLEGGEGGGSEIVRVGQHRKMNHANLRSAAGISVRFRCEYAK
jgi:hypothetical protein